MTMIVTRIMIPLLPKDNDMKCFNVRNMPQEAMSVFLQYIHFGLNSYQN